MSRSRWRLAVAMLTVSWLAVVCFYWQTAVSMAGTWWQGGYDGAQDCPAASGGISVAERIEDIPALVKQRLQ